VKPLNKTPKGRPQERQPKKSPSSSITSDVRILACQPRGEFTLYERKSGSSIEWLNVAVSNSDDHSCWRFGWNGQRASYTDDSEHLRLHHPEIFAGVVATLEELTRGEGTPEMRACRRDWLMRIQNKMEADRVAKEVARK
jgi:hypothetical protein